MTQPVDPQRGPQRKKRRLTPIGGALLYAVFAALWITVSGALLNMSVDDPVLQGRIEIAKGLLFVAVTSSLLYVVLREWGASVSAAAAISRSRSAVRRVGAGSRTLLLVILSLLVPLSGFVVLKVHEPQVEREAFANLKAIADLKASQIENWLYERQNDGAVIMASADLLRQVAALQKEQDADGAVREAVRAHLISAVDPVQYEAALLVDPLSQPLLEIGKFRGQLPSTTALLQPALETHQARHSEVVADADGALRPDFVVPLVSFASNGQRESVGGLILSVRPEQFMFPFVEHWPTPSASG